MLGIRNGRRSQLDNTLLSVACVVGASGLDVERLLVKRHQSSGLKQEIDKLDVQAS